MDNTSNNCIFSNNVSLSMQFGGHIKQTITSYIRNIVYVQSHWSVARNEITTYILEQVNKFIHQILQTHFDSFKFMKTHIQSNSLIIHWYYDYKLKKINLIIKMNSSNTNFISDNLRGTKMDDKWWSAKILTHISHGFLGEDHVTNLNVAIM